MQEQLIKESKEISKASENESTWFKIFSFFEKLIKLEDKQRIYLGVFPIISDLLLRSIQSDRSRLNGIALDFLKECHTYCFSEFNFNQFLPILVKLNGKANKVFVTRALETIKIICKSIEIKYIHKVAVDNIDNVNKNIRFAIFSMIKLRYSDSPEFFISLIEKGLKDPSLEVRTVCKDVNVQKTEVTKVPNQIIKNPILSLTPRKNFKIDEKHAEIKKLETEVIEIAKKQIVSKPLNSNFFEKLNQLKKERFADEKQKSDELTPRKLDKYLEKFRNSTPIEFITKKLSDKPNDENNNVKLNDTNKFENQHSSHLVSRALDRLSVSEDCKKHQAIEIIKESAINEYKIENDNLSNSILYSVGNVDSTPLPINTFSEFSNNVKNQDSNSNAVDSKILSPFKIITAECNDSNEPFKIINTDIVELQANNTEVRDENKMAVQLMENENITSQQDFSFIHQVAEQDIVNQRINSDNLFEPEVIDEYNNSLVFEDQYEKSTSLIENSPITNLSKSFASITIEPSNIEISPKHDRKVMNLKYQTELNNDINEEPNPSQNNNCEVEILINEYCDNNIDLIQRNEMSIENLKTNIKLMEDSLCDIIKGSKSLVDNCEFEQVTTKYTNIEENSIIQSAKRLEDSITIQSNKCETDTNLDNSIHTPVEILIVTDQIQEQASAIDSNVLNINNILKSVADYKDNSNKIRADETVILDQVLVSQNPNPEFSFLERAQENPDVCKISFIENNCESYIQDNTIIQDYVAASETEFVETPMRNSSVPLFNEHIFDSEDEDVSKKSFVMHEKPSFNLDSSHK